MNYETFCKNCHVMASTMWGVHTKHEAKIFSTKWLTEYAADFEDLAKQMRDLARVYQEENKK